MADPKRVESEVRSVTLFRWGAEVTRVARVSAAEGLVALGGLPLSLEDGSVQVAVDAASGAEARATDLRVGLEVPPVDPAKPPAEPEALEDAILAVDVEDAEVARLEEQRAKLARLGVTARPTAPEGEPPPPSPMVAREKLIELRGELARAADEALGAARARQREARRRLATLEEADARASSDRQARSFALRKVLQTSLEGGGAASLRVTYRVPAARWSPAYVLRVDEAFRSATLEVRAAVAQRTGEDWSAVALTLSTADATSWVDLPELRSLRIGRRQPRPARIGFRPAPQDTEALFGDYDRSLALPLTAVPSVRHDRLDALRRELRALEDDDHGATSGRARRGPAGPATRVPATRPPPRPQARREAAPAARPSARAAPAAEMTASFAVPAALGAPGDPAAQDEGPHAGGPPAPVARGGTLPPPAAAVAAGLVPETFARSRGGSPLGGLASAAGGVAAAVAAGAAGMFDGPPAPPPTVLALDDDDATGPGGPLDYGRLRLPGPDAPRRGRLVPRTPRDLYRQELEASGGGALDLDLALQHADQARRTLREAPLPPGCLPPSAEAGFDYAYRSEGRIDAPSDGAFHTLEVLSHRSQARMRYVVVPREAREVFRFLELANPLDAPLLAGPVDVYRGDAFLLTGELDTVPPRGNVRLGLGVEQGIKVSRNTRYREQSGGMLGGERRLLHEVHVEVANRLRRPIDLEVRERIPVVPEHEDDIEIHEGPVSPPWQAWDPEHRDDLEGGRRWRITVPAGEVIALTAAYEIRIAAKHELVGGNRRERP
ncbi:MAG: DUF4139 domain-containing protein [Sandaracinaceae bacterium]